MKLTIEQQAHLDCLLKLRGVTTYWLGVDVRRNPVIRVVDAFGRDQTYVIQAGGEGRPLFGPVRELSDEEVETFDPASFEYLMRTQPPT